MISTLTTPSVSHRPLSSLMQAGSLRRDWTESIRGTQIELPPMTEAEKLLYGDCTDIRDRVLIDCYDY